MAMAASLAPIFFASLYCTGTGPHVARLHRFYSSTAVNRPRRSCATLSSRLDSFTPDDGDLQDELQHGFLPQRRDGLPVFVTLPADAVSPAGKLRRRKAMAQSFRALVAAGVEGVVMEVWWGMVEKDAPRVYDWRPYQEIVALASMLGLKVRAVMAFHQGGSGPEDPHWFNEISIHMDSRKNLRGMVAPYAHEFCTSDYQINARSFQHVVPTWDPFFRPVLVGGINDGAPVFHANIPHGFILLWRKNISTREI